MCALLDLTTLWLCGTRCSSLLSVCQRWRLCSSPPHSESGGGGGGNQLYCEASVSYLYPLEYQSPRGPMGSAAKRHCAGIVPIREADMQADPQQQHETEEKDR